MSILVSIAKLYVRFVFRDEEYDALKTQRDFNVPDPPRGIAKRCELLSGDVRGFWIDKANAGRGVLVYLHGGAFYFGPVKEHWDYIARISKLTGMAAIVVDYGLAPQEPFPKGLDQIVELVTTLDLPDKWFFLGDSSGAAMALAACFRLRRKEMPLPAKLIFMSPWLDLTLENREIPRIAPSDPMMTVERLSSAAYDYLGGGSPYDPYYSPMFGDFTGLPPMLIQTGTADLLWPDCKKFYQKCLNEGVDATYEEYPECFHDFMMLSVLPEARRALRSQTAFLCAP